MARSRGARGDDRDRADDRRRPAARAAPPQRLARAAGVVHAGRRRREPGLRPPASVHPALLAAAARATGSGAHMDRHPGGTPVRHRPAALALLGHLNATDTIAPLTVSSASAAVPVSQTVGACGAPAKVMP